MYPGYKDKLYLTKLFLIILILGSETMEYGLFQIATACDKWKNKKTLCESEVVGVWEDECIL